MATEKSNKSTKRKREEYLVRDFASRVALQLQTQQPQNINYSKLSEDLSEWADVFLEEERKAHPKTFRLCIMESNLDGHEVFFIPDASPDERNLMKSLAGHLPSDMLKLPHFFGAVDIECEAILEWLRNRDTPPRCEQTAAKLAKLEDGGMRRMMTPQFKIGEDECISRIDCCVQIKSWE